MTYFRPCRVQIGMKAAPAGSAHPGLLMACERIELPGNFSKHGGRTYPLPVVMAVYAQLILSSSPSTNEYIMVPPLEAHDSTFA